MPLTDLLQWLGSAQRTGTLVVRGERYTKSLYLREGRIISSASDDPTEQLGQFLLSHGKITEEDLRKGLEAQAKTKVLLGKILLMVGSIKEDELKRLLVMKAEGTIFSLFLLSGAHFDFLDGELPRDLFVPINLEMQDVLMKGLTIIDELRHIRSQLGSGGTILARTRTPLPAGFPADRSVGKAVLGLVDGKRTITDICLALHATEFTVSKFLYRMVEKQYIEVIRKTESESGPVAHDDRPFVSIDQLVSHARERMTAGDFDAAIDLTAQALAAAPRDIAIRNLHDEACARFRETAHRTILPPAKVPFLTRPLEQMTSETLTPQEVFLISRINGTWDLKSIIDISPMGEIDALRVMKRLQERGLVELR